MTPPRKKSLQDVLRERRAAAPLVSARELRERELTRQREAAEREASELVARWRTARTAVDADGKLAPDVVREVFRLSRPAYFASRHWARRTRAQRALAPACEVARCGGTEGLEPWHVSRDALGAEAPGRDLMTLCEGCLRRAAKLEQERRRLPSREELEALDPERPLFTPAEIAALRAKHARAPRPG